MNVYCIFLIFTIRTITSQEVRHSLHKWKVLKIYHTNSTVERIFFIEFNTRWYRLLILQKCVLGNTEGTTRFLGCNYSKSGQLFYILVFYICVVGTYRWHLSPIFHFRIFAHGTDRYENCDVLSFCLAMLAPPPHPW